MSPTQDGLTEPEIVINDRPLTFAECMTVRVAVSSFAIMLQDETHRAGIGERLAANYAHHVGTIEDTMIFGLPLRGDDRLVQLAIAYHKNVEGEYGCPGPTCPGVQRLVRLLRQA